MRIKQFRTIILGVLLVPLNIWSQADRLGEDIQYGFSLRGTSGGGDNAPFWFTNNKYGLGPIDRHSVQARAYIS